MSTRIKLTDGEYWKLRALGRDVEAIAHDVQKAQQRVNAHLAALAEAHGFDAAKVYGWDDATCELIEQEPAKAN